MTSGWSSGKWHAVVLGLSNPSRSAELDQVHESFNAEEVQNQWEILNHLLPGENARQANEIVYGVYGADTVTANYVQFLFYRFRSGIFDVKDASLTGRPVVEHVYKITEIIEVDQHMLVVVESSKS
ncbi:hypothetical protein TNCV_4815641 [Trichonephila clavipes]|nr:hypothetical protein TNCV_4815641 [Trichonephila clavipes]